MRPHAPFLDHRHSPGTLCRLCSGTAADTGYLRIPATRRQVGGEGCARAVITDLPIILGTLFIISRLSAFQNGLGLISWAGGLFILYTGYESMRTPAVKVAIEDEPPRSLLKGAVANILNPHPYLFWISVGAPTMSKAVTTGMLALAAFIGGFYLSLVGSKIMLAMAVGNYRSFLTGKVYRYTLRFLGLLLCAFACILFRDGAILLGLL